MESPPVSSIRVIAAHYCVYSAIQSTSTCYRLQQHIIASQFIDRVIPNLVKSSIYSAGDVPVSLYILILVGIFWNSICNYSLILPYSTTHLCNLVQLYSVPNDTIKTKTPFSFIGVNTALRNIQPAASGMKILSHMQYAVLYTVCQY